MYNPQLDVDVGVLPEMLQTQFIRSGEKSQAASTVAPSITYKIDDVRNDHSTKGWRLSAADTSINQSIHFAIEIDLIDDGDNIDDIMNQRIIYSHWSAVPRSTFISSIGPLHASHWNRCAIIECLSLSLCATNTIDPRPTTTAW